MNYRVSNVAPRLQVEQLRGDWRDLVAWTRKGAPVGVGHDADLRAAGNLRLFYKWCQRWTATLCRLRGTFDGDLDQYLLLLVFIHAEAARSMTTLSAAARREALVDMPSRGINALSAAEICGIPRETTRRKLGLLVKKGYLAVRSDGLFYLTGHYALPQALGDLVPLMDPAALVSETTWPEAVTSTDAPKQAATWRDAPSRQGRA